MQENNTQRTGGKKGCCLFFETLGQLRGCLTAINQPLNKSNSQPEMYSLKPHRDDTLSSLLTNQHPSFSEPLRTTYEGTDQPRTGDS